ncbi:hypothetical protein NKR23_g12370 [Pleurostoma richardsiae]|uniref:Ubiquitin-like protease family profile domain-containing protein n=1 Tax=Pleurostoma richardsiae TaxID=41990 RepID=A0AA38R0B6_9PEZI|nr:hypothetical protein NKR23_g12370 [Pleurostoma richardsiae]
MVEAGFADLGFRYQHAPCPQQEDGSSCGLMVIRNAALRMNGQEVGNSDDKVDPGRVLRQLIGLLQTGLESNALRPKMAVRRSKRKVS